MIAKPAAIKIKPALNIMIELSAGTRCNTESDGSAGL